jgi:ribosome-associated translation inhibitor RaiA
MQLMPTITFRGVEPTAALEAEIRTRIDRLETYYRSITRCRVVVEERGRNGWIGSRRRN